MNRRPWWVGDTVQQTVHSAREAGAGLQRLVTQLQQTTLQGVEPARIRTIIDTVPDRGPDFSLPDKQQTTDAPREGVDRFIGVDDVAYLTDRELARILSVGLERFGGSTSIQSDTEGVTVDLIWNRSHTSAALRTITRDDGRRVGANALREIADGATAPDGGRSPSIVAIVTNSRFTGSAQDIADDQGYTLVSETTLSLWLSRFQLPPAVFGVILEEGELAETDLESLVDDLEPLPRPIREQDPFDLADVDPPESAGSTTAKAASSGAVAGQPGASSGQSGQITWQSSKGVSPTPAQSPATPSGASQPSPGDSATSADEEATSASGQSFDDAAEPGQFGTLYADADADGDYGVLDDLLTDSDDAATEESR